MQLSSCVELASKHVYHKQTTQHGGLTQKTRFIDLMVHGPHARANTCTHVKEHMRSRKARRADRSSRCDLRNKNGGVLARGNLISVSYRDEKVSRLVLLIVRPSHGVFLSPRIPAVGNRVAANPR